MRGTLPTRRCRRVRRRKSRDGWRVPALERIRRLGHHFTELGQKPVCRVISLRGPHVVLGTGSEYLWRIPSPSTRGRRPGTANAQ